MGKSAPALRGRAPRLVAMALVVVGLLAIALGIALVYVPAGVIALGIGLVVIGGVMVDVG